MMDDVLKVLVFTHTVKGDRWCGHYQQFIKNDTLLIVEDEAVFNVYSWIHLPDDVEMFDPLDKFSVFLFEPFMQAIQSDTTFRNMLVERIFLCIRLRNAHIGLYETHPTEMTHCRSL